MAIKTANGDGSLENTLASKLPYSYGTATPSTSDDGFLWYDSNSTPPEVKFWDGAAFQALTSGKILQIVRATDSTQRTTTSSSYVDANLSVTITPTKTTSAIILLHTGLQAPQSGSTNYQSVAITDNSNNIIASDGQIGHSVSSAIYVSTSLFAYDTPATTSATTYKARFLSVSASTQARLRNDLMTGQLYAIEVSA